MLSGSYNDRCFSININLMRALLSLYPVFVLLAGGIAIGFSPILVRLSDLGPVATAFYRLSLALPLLFIMLKLVPATAKQVSPDRHDTGLFLLAGTAFALDIICWHWSITLTTVANATLFANIAPVFVVIGSWLVWRQKPTTGFVIALLAGLTGVVILMGSNIESDPTQLKGDLLGIVTAFFYAIYILSVSQLRKQHSAMKIMFRSTLVSALIVLPVALMSENQLWFTSLQGFFILLTLALLSHATGQGMITWALAHLSAAFSSLTLLIQPVVAAILAWLLFAETLNKVQLAGVVLVLVAIVLAGNSRKREDTNL